MELSSVAQMVSADENARALLKFRDAAGEIGMTESQFRLAVERTGNLKVIVLGPGTRRIQRRDLYDWIERNRAEFKDVPRPAQGRPRKNKSS